MIVDCALYRGGRRDPSVSAVADAARHCERGASFAWVGLADPTGAELAEVSEAFGIHELSVVDALSRTERPKLEHFGTYLSVVLRTARYDDAEESVDFGQVTLFFGATFIVVVRRGEATRLGGLRAELERNPDQLSLGTSAVLVAIMHEVVLSYGPVIAGLENDIDEVEDQVFDPESAQPTERLYYLLRETLGVHRALMPMKDVLGRLTEEHLDSWPELGPYVRDLQDALADTNDRVTSGRDLLTGALDANLAQVSVRQNNDMRMISAWVAILAVPTMLAGIYGMNFDTMWELRQNWGYPAVIGLMVVVCLLLFRRFRRAGWL